MKWQDRLVLNWYIREFGAAFEGAEVDGEYAIRITFSSPIRFDGDVPWSTEVLTVVAFRRTRRKYKWVPWRGDALYDWNKQQLMFPRGGRIFVLFTPGEIREWETLEGELPDPKIGNVGIKISVPWDPVGEIPELRELGTVEYFACGSGWQKSPPQQGGDFARNSPPST